MHTLHFLCRVQVAQEVRASMARAAEAAVPVVAEAVKAAAGAASGDN